MIAPTDWKSIAAALTTAMLATGDDGGVAAGMLSDIGLYGMQYDRDVTSYNQQVANPPQPSQQASDYAFWLANIQKQWALCVGICAFTGASAPPFDISGMSTPAMVTAMNTAIGVLTNDMKASAIGALAGLNLRFSGQPFKPPTLTLLPPAPTLPNQLVVALNRAAAYTDFLQKV